jgi:DNA-directed RNA polymerase specialized sigma24 family protein
VVVQPYTVFYEHIEELFLPAFILTGSIERAEDCFLRAIDLTASYAMVNDAYIYSVARRCVMKAAIGVIAKEIRKCADMESRLQDGDRQPDTSLVPDVLGDSETPIVNNLLRLNPLRRAALILRIFEKYQRKDMALLLGVSMPIAELASKRGLIEYLHHIRTAVQSTSGVLVRLRRH